MSEIQGHSAAGRIMSMNNPNNPNGNRTRDLPVCSAVPQPTAPPRILTASFTECSLNFWHTLCSNRASDWMTKESRSNFQQRQRPNRSRGPPNFLLNGYLLFFPRVKKSPGVTATTYIHLVPKLRINGNSLPHRQHLHGVVVNKLSMRIRSVTGNSEQGSQGKETTLTSVITYQMTSTEKKDNLAWRKEHMS